MTTKPHSYLTDKQKKVVKMVKMKITQKRKNWAGHDIEVTFFTHRHKLV